MKSAGAASLACPRNKTATLVTNLAERARNSGILVVRRRTDRAALVADRRCVGRLCFDRAERGVFDEFIDDAGGGRDGGGQRRPAVLYRLCCGCLAAPVHCSNRARNLRGDIFF